MTKLVGTELIGFTVTNGRVTGRVVDYDDGIYYVSTKEREDFEEFILKNITVVHLGGKVA